MMRRAVVALFLVALTVVGASALETDQYSTWGVPLEDGTAPLNARINFEILRALATVEERNSGLTPTCQQISQEFHSRISFAIMQPIEAWATHSTLVPRLPPTPAEEVRYRRSNIYGDYGPLDIGRWVPDSPTVQVNGVRFGTDKISHFFSSGWRYRDEYIAATEKGLSEDDAQDAAIRWGVFEERFGTGLLVDGVFSRGDLEANLAGMRFYLCLCEGSDPLLTLDDGRWKQRRPFDWREYVTPAWDESYHVSVYSPFRWRKVRPRLLEYCGRRSDPDVVQRMEYYRASHRPSPNDKVIDELVRDGSLSDPSLFTLDANCPPIPAGGSPPRIDGNGSADSNVPGTLMGSSPLATEEALFTEIAARADNRERRVYLLAGLTLTSYEGPAPSLGWLFTKLESDFDCQTVCDVRGPTVQIEPGLDGGQLTFGYARIFGETWSHKRFLATPYFALGARGVILRTWSDGDLGPSGLTFLGVQGQFTVTRVSFKLGVLWHAGGENASHNQEFTWGFGWGF